MGVDVVEKEPSCCLHPKHHLVVLPDDMRPRHKALYHSPQSFGASLRLYVEEGVEITLWSLLEEFVLLDCLVVPLLVLFERGVGEELLRILVLIGQLEEDVGVQENGSEDEDLG